MKTSPSRPLLRAAAVAVVALFGLAACDSQPSAKRVAEDLVNTLAETDAERECMLDKLDVYSADELQAIGNDAADGDVAAQEAADAELAALQAELETCLN